MFMIPKTLYVYDAKIQRTMTYKYISKTNKGLYLYENINTGCRQCFNKNEIQEILEEK